MNGLLGMAHGVVHWVSCGANRLQMFFLCITLLHCVDFAAPTDSSIANGFENFNLNLCLSCVHVNVSL